MTAPLDLDALRHLSRPWTSEEEAALLAEVERLRAAPCPHVVTADEGTSYCALAENSVPRSSLVQIGWWDSGVFVLRRTVTRSDPAYDRPVYVIREDTE